MITRIKPFLKAARIIGYLAGQEERYVVSTELGGDTETYTSKVLGGSSAINGMYLVRPNSVEVNAWHDLIAPNGTTAADNWSWNSLLAAMKKSENFTPPITAVQSVAGMQYQNSSHGTNGPLQASYPA